MSNSQQNCKLVTPAGVKLENVQFTKLTKIGFSFPKATLTPLQPLTVTENSGDNTLKVSSIVFIDEQFVINKDNISVIQDLSYTNDKEAFLNFHICYDDIEKKSQNYTAYRLDYTTDWSAYTKNEKLAKEGIPLEYPIPSDKITFVTTFLWDTDPILSRGTVTTVQQA